MIQQIEQLLSAAIDSLRQTGELTAEIEVRVAVERTRDDGYGDLATNLALRLAKPCAKNPRELAEHIVSRLPPSDVVGSTEIAGPGFINFFFAPEWLSGRVRAMARSDRAGVAEDDDKQTVVVDYSAPNVAKEMHVGHIRSTIIGDTIARTLEFLGHRVVRANHIGDWGTQFGMLIARLEEVEAGGRAILDSELGDLEAFYREAKQRYDTDEAFAEKSRGYVVRLQGGDPWCLAHWQTLVDVTMSQNQRCYERLNVTLEQADTMGESLYNDMLPGIVEDLRNKGLAVEDNGATVVFLDEYRTKDGDPIGVIVQKKDGGYLYTTTDIACAKYRYERFGADRLVYCVDSRQAQHLSQAWIIARKAGYLPDSVATEHHAFGMILGKDGKPFKTRQGGTVKLVDLLREAHERAEQLLKRKDPGLESATLDIISEAVGIGAVKYADLSKNRHTDYIFDWDTMLSFDGNTAPYLQYAYTRIRSVLDKSGVDVAGLDAPVILEEEPERQLARALVWFPSAVASVAVNGLPHLLCGHLYEVSRAFTRFYERCPVNRSDVAEATRHSRQMLCLSTARVLETGLSLLGIRTLERM